MALLKKIKSLAEFETLLTEKASSLVVVDFHATWCGPCHAIAPFYEELSQKHRHVTFTKVDVDAVEEVAKKYKIRAMPTFLFIKNKEVVETLQGANPPALKAAVAKHAGPPPTAAPSSGSSSLLLMSDMSLLEFLDSRQTNCLNEHTEHSIKDILSSKRKNTSAAYLQSEADEQLLINIFFSQTVRIRSLLIHSANKDSGPKLIKIQVNKPTLGFEDVENANEPEVAQILELTPENVAEGQTVPLWFVRFQSVTSLHIFVASNHGGTDETIINAIDIFGVPVEGADMSALKKDQHDH